MVIYALFLLNCRESLVRAFRKKTPLSVRRTWGGGTKGGMESVHRNMTFFRDGFPYILHNIGQTIFLKEEERIRFCKRVGGGLPEPFVVIPLHGSFAELRIQIKIVALKNFISLEVRQKHKN